jgi:hypothetical protein
MAHQITGEGGVSLSPGVHGNIVSEGGASLAPTAPEALTNLGSAAAYSVTVTGVLTAEAEPVVFPTLLPAGTYNGEMSWTDDGTSIDEMGAGQRLFYLAPYWYLAWDADIAASWRSPSGLASPIGAAPWTPNSEATGQPTIAKVAPVAPHVLIAEGGADLAPPVHGVIVPEGG